MQQIFSKIEELEVIGDILRFAAVICAEQGVIRHSFHLTPLFDEPNSMRAAVIAKGFSNEWLELYDREDFRSSDPIPSRTMHFGSLLTWQEAQRIEPNTKANETYFRAMKEHGLIHGFGLPLFGPRGRNAYSSYDFGKPFGEVSPEAITTIRTVAQVANQRIAVIADKQKRPPSLSKRENEVLFWLVRGKSISVIGQILEISPETVKTYVTRIYEKLGANNRIGATVRAIKLDIIDQRVR